MLTPEEALLMKAAYDEQDRQQAMNAAGLLGAAGGAAMGAAGGAPLHALGKALGGQKPGIRGRLKPGPRLAGGLTGMILGGGLGAGVAAMMKQESPAARLLGKMQSGQELDVVEREAIAQELAEIYRNPQVLM